uniref:NADH-ubiquinone oxidoreductase chain 2 n=1 Tax=Paracaecilius japanus TaxID=297965 RepID=A0A8K1ZG40_9NEOP|nr:NADH dehydrogenase subunit 2 [Paracaecilius japanus]
MLNNLNLLFFIMTSFGAIISFSATNWFSAWMGLEINMISFIPLFMNNKNTYSTEAAMNYFLVQASASAMFLFFCINNSLMNTSGQYFIETIYSLLIVTPLLIKLGSAPFHTWFVNMMQSLNFSMCFALVTMQKLAPLFIMNFSFNFKLILIFSIFSVIVGSIGGLNQTFLKKILAFSSINHLGWMLASMNISKIVLINYFLFYSFMNIFVIIFLNKFSINQFNQGTSNLSILTLSTSILSLGGLPPFLGFLPKWMMIQMLALNKYFIMVAIFILTALITLLYYLRLIYSSLLLNASTQKWFKPFSLVDSTTIFFLISTSCLSLALFNLII